MDEKKILEEILTWHRLQGINLLKDLLPNLLNSTEKRKAYELTDGKNNRAAIQKATGAGAGTISGWWSTWQSFGIVKKEGQKYSKIVSLKDLEIPLKI